MWSCGLLVRWFTLSISVCSSVPPPSGRTAINAPKKQPSATPMKKPRNAVFRMPKGGMRRARRKAECGRLKTGDKEAVGAAPNAARRAPAHRGQAVRSPKAAILFAREIVEALHVAEVVGGDEGVGRVFCVRGHCLHGHSGGA